MAACLLLEYGLAASATAIGWSDYLNNFLVNATGWQVPASHCIRPMLVSGANGSPNSILGSSTCRRSSWSSCACCC